jgi:hypothetical protein
MDAIELNNDLQTYIVEMDEEELLSCFTPKEECTQQLLLNVGESFFFVNLKTGKLIGTDTMTESQARSYNEVAWHGNPYRWLTLKEYSEENYGKHQ